MRYMPLGYTGLEVSAPAMGSIQITRLEWKQSIRLVREVVDLGVNLFDTAPVYFDSEKRLGEGLSRPFSERRKRERSGTWVSPPTAISGQ